MKDYYYILGIRPTATTEEIKKAYRKLSLKFHPDKNNGDDFFTEHFKEIQEAYEILGDSSERKIYDDLKTNSSSNRQNNKGTNFNPEIEYFKSNKQAFEYDEELTFSWRTINTDKVILKPFGLVQPIGQKTYRIKDFKNSFLTFELTAVNSHINRQTSSSLTLTNKTYKDLYGHFKEILRKEEQNRSYNDQNTSQERRTSNMRDEEIEEFSLSNKQIKIIVAIGIIISSLILLLGH